MPPAPHSTRLLPRGRVCVSACAQAGAHDSPSSLHREPRASLLRDHLCVCVCVFVCACACDAACAGTGTASIPCFLLPYLFSRLRFRPLRFSSSVCKGLRRNLCKVVGSNLVRFRHGSLEDKMPNFPNNHKKGKTRGAAEEAPRVAQGRGSPAHRCLGTEVEGRSGHVGLRVPSARQTAEARCSCSRAFLGTAASPPFSGLQRGKGGDADARCTAGGLTQRSSASPDLCRRSETVKGHRAWLSLERCASVRASSASSAHAAFVCCSCVLCARESAVAVRCFALASSRCNDPHLPLLSSPMCPCTGKQCRLTQSLCLLRHAACVSYPITPSPCTSPPPKR